MPRCFQDVKLERSGRGWSCSTDRSECPCSACQPLACRCLAEGLSERTSWQDLKDFGREAGPVAYADVFRDRGKIQG